MSEPMTDILRAGGIPDAAIAAWHEAAPQASGVFTEDCRRFGVLWRLADELIAHLPKKPERSPAQAKAAETVFAAARAARERILRDHAQAVYADVTHDFSRFVRVEELVFAAAERVPGLVPTRAQVDAEAMLLQRDKDGR